MNKYSNEVKEKYGNTTSYQEYSEKTKNYSVSKWNDITKGLDDIFEEFALKMQSGISQDTEEVQLLVYKLKNYITDNYYACTKEMLLNLGKMYVEDIRFKNNIDQFAIGTALYISLAINTFCS